MLNGSSSKSCEDPGHERDSESSRKKKLQCLFCRKLIDGNGVTTSDDLSGRGSDGKRSTEEIVEKSNTENTRKRKLTKDINGGPKLAKRATTDISDFQEMKSFLYFQSETPNFTDGSDTETGSETGQDSKKKLEKEETTGMPDDSCNSIEPQLKREFSSDHRADRADRAVAKWWFEADVPVDAALSEYYRPMLDAIKSTDQDYKMPTRQDLVGKLLNQQQEEADEALQNNRAFWSEYGCSLLAVRQTDDRRGVWIKFFVHSIKGSTFLELIDVTNVINDRERLIAVFDDVINFVGPENIVQVITDGSYEFMGVGHELENKYDHLYCVICASDSISFILGELTESNNFPAVVKAMSDCRKITRFVYGHSWARDLMKNVTNGTDLISVGMSKPVTSFLTIKRILIQRTNLVKMVTSTEWNSSEESAQEISKIISDEFFWADCKLTVSITEPFLKILDVLEKENDAPAMGTLFDAIERAKLVISSRLEHDKPALETYMRIIDSKWVMQFRCPLQASACCLNPAVFFSPSFKHQGSVVSSFLDAVCKLEPDPVVQDLLNLQSIEYRFGNGCFGKPIAIRNRSKLNPIAWWQQFGNSTPELQQLAIKLLAQCCSLLPYKKFRRLPERSRGGFVNHLERQRLRDVSSLCQKLKFQRSHDDNNTVTDDDRRPDEEDPTSIEHAHVTSEWFEATDDEDTHEWNVPYYEVEINELEEGVG